MQTFLVTGGNGLLGQKLTERLRTDAGVRLVVTGHGENRNVNKEGYIYEPLDISDHGSVRQLIEKYRPDVVINAAAMTNVDACETEKDLAVALNVTAVENIARLSVEFNFHLVHISTDFIFDGTKKMYVEEDEPNPLSFYGKSKLDGERMIRKYAKNYAILRTVLVYGFTAGASRSNVVLWAMGVIKEGKSANVVDDQFRTPTLSEDLAEGCILAAKKRAQGIFNISGKDYMSIYELVQRVAAFFGMSIQNITKIKSDRLNQPAKRPPLTGLDISKARRELGYEPHSFEEGLALMQKQMAD